MKTCIFGNLNVDKLGLIIDPTRGRLFDQFTSNLNLKIRRNAYYT